MRECACREGTQAGGGRCESQYNINAGEVGTHCVGAVQHSLQGYNTAKLGATIRRWPMARSPLNVRKKCGRASQATPLHLPWEFSQVV